MTREQAIGYLIATIDAELSYLEAVDKAALVMELERQFETLQPADAMRIYEERWGQYNN